MSQEEQQVLKGNFGTFYQGLFEQLKCLNGQPKELVVKQRIGFSYCVVFVTFVVK